MEKKNQQEFVISVGGSLLVGAQGLDYKFIKKFRDFIVAQVTEGKRFYLVVGGGLTARSYIQAALKISPIKPRDRDWVGIMATRLNAELLRSVFGSLAHPEVILNPETSLKSRAPVMIGAGYVPGFSTDHCSILLAKNKKIDTVINLSNIDYAYDRDPRVFSEAKRLVNVSWLEFRKIVGSSWQPGLNLPFDPVASREAQAYKIKVLILNGKKLSNLADCLNGKRFKGTTIA